MYFYFNAAVMSKSESSVPPARVIFAGPRQSTIQTSKVGTSELARQGLGLWLGRQLAPEAFGGNGRPLTIVSGHANGSDQSGEALARHLAIPTLVMPAMWDAINPATGRPYGRAAGSARNHEMHKLATGLVATLPDWGGPHVKKIDSPGGNFVLRRPGHPELLTTLRTMRDVNRFATHLIKDLAFNYDDVVHALDMALRYGPGFEDGTHGIEGLDDFYDEMREQFPLSGIRDDVRGGEHNAVLNSESTGTKDMVERSRGKRGPFSGPAVPPIPAITFHMSHTRGGGRLRSIKFSGEDGQEYYVYDADNPLSEEESAAIGAPPQDEIDERLERIHKHFSGPEKGILRNPREGRYEWVPPHSRPGDGEPTRFKIHAENLLDEDPEYDAVHDFPHGLGPDFEGIQGRPLPLSSHLVSWPTFQGPSSVDYRGTDATHSASAWRKNAAGFFIPPHNPLDCFVRSTPSGVTVRPEHPFPKMVQTVVNRHVVLGDDSDPAEKASAAINMAKNHS